MDRNAVIDEISASFRGVALEDGIGILEAEAIDSYASDAVREEARRKDFREDWQAIPEEVIARQYTALCFMDAKGLRFNLLAFMTFTLKNFDRSSSASMNATIYALCRGPEELADSLRLLTLKQRKAVALFLRFVVTEIGERWLNSWQASLAYEKTWCIFDR